MNAYERTLRFALEHPLVLGLFTVLLIGGSYLCFKNHGSDLLPAMDEGGFIVDYVMPAGSSLRETNRVISHVEQILRARRRWRAPRAARVCNSAWRPLRKRIRATSV